MEKVKGIEYLNGSCLSYEAESLKNPSASTLQSPSVPEAALKSYEGQMIL